MQSIVTNGYHYIRNGDGREELFNMADDSGEEHNLAGTSAGQAVLAQMRAHNARQTGKAELALGCPLLQVRD